MARQTKKLPGDMPDAGTTPETKPELGFVLPMEPAMLPAPEPTMAEIHAQLMRMETFMLQSRPDHGRAEMMAALTRFEQTLILLTELVQAPTIMALLPQAMGELKAQMKEALRPDLERLIENIEIAARTLEALPSELDQASQRTDAIIKKAAEWAYRTLLMTRDEATVSIQAIQNTAHNHLAQISTDAREWNSSLARHVRGRLRETSDQAIEGMADATKGLNRLVEIVGPIATSMETFVSELDYVTPALPQNAERRLRRLALHTGLICSALTTVSIGLTVLLLRKVGF